MPTSRRRPAPPCREPPSHTAACEPGSHGKAHHRNPPGECLLPRVIQLNRVEGETIPSHIPANVVQFATVQAGVSGKSDCLENPAQDSMGRRAEILVEDSHPSGWGKVVQHGPYSPVVKQPSHHTPKIRIGTRDPAPLSRANCPAMLRKGVAPIVPDEMQSENIKPRSLAQCLHPGVGLRGIHNHGATCFAQYASVQYMRRSAIVLVPRGPAQQLVP